nr:MAG: E2 protein [Arctocephalus gazella papillomavirus 1]
MMETLSQRLGALQDKMMDLFEQQSSQLNAHVQYWSLQRQEHAMMYVARQQGLNKLGLSAVPPMHVSKARAEDAIQMHLELCSLQESEFGSLPWTLRETSLERYKANPQGTFKKEGTSVTVHYDNNAENAVDYTLWKHVYDHVDGAWTRCEGGADEKGLYICRTDRREYYEDFQKDSARYGTTGTWTVNCGGNQTFYFPNSSGSSKQPIPDAPDSAKQAPAPSAQRPQTSTDRPSDPGERPCAKEAELGRGQGKLPTVWRKRPGDGLERDPDRIPPILHGGTWGRPQPYKVDRRAWRHQVSLLQHQHLQQQQQQLQQQQQQLQQLQQQLQQQQRGCSPGPDSPLSTQAPASALLPCVVLSGRPNPLKCLRYRLWQKYGGLVEDISTTWTWARRGQRDRDRESKISLVFRNEEVRTKFLGQVCLPKGVSASLGMLPY